MENLNELLALMDRNSSEHHSYMMTLLECVSTGRMDLVDSAAKVGVMMEQARSLEMSLDTQLELKKRAYRLERKIMNEMRGE